MHAPPPPTHDFVFALTYFFLCNKNLTFYTKIVLFKIKYLVNVRAVGKITVQTLVLSVMLTLISVRLIEGLCKVITIDLKNVFRNIVSIVSENIMKL